MCCSAAPNSSCSPASACEFPLGVEPPELENNPPPREEQGRKPRAALLNRTPSLSVSAQQGAGAAHTASSFGEENEECLVSVDVWKGIYIAWSMEGGGEKPQNVDKLEENRFSG